MFQASRRDYTIIFLNDKTGEEDVKCTRSYEDFYTLYQSLLILYPYIPLPKLTKKDLVNKITSQISSHSEDWYAKRLLQINFFINYLNNHPNLSKEDTTTKFINDKELNKQRFENIPPFFECNESLKYSPTTSNIMGIIKKMIG